MLKYDASGLIVAIAQDDISGDIRMVAWMNAEAVAQTLQSGKATFYSRSREQLWTKGESSGNTLAVRAVYLDCDNDSLILRVRPAGPTCHTGQPTCFFRKLHAEDGLQVEESEIPPPTFLAELEQEIAQRAAASTAKKSYTRHLLDGGASLIGAKVQEESMEFAQAIASESADRVASEAADVLYHLMVGLHFRGVGLRQVMEVLAERSGVSGHAEKASRSKA